MFRIHRKRSKQRLVNASGYVDLPTACVRANQTGFFGLSQRVNPESFDGKDTNIDVRNCFFGGRRVELAIQAQNAEDFANRAATPAESSGNDSGSGIGSSE